MDTIVRPKQVIYWPNFVTWRRRRRRHMYLPECATSTEAKM